MTDLTKILDEFKKLSLEDKKKKLVEFIVSIKKPNPLFLEAVNIIKSNKYNIDEQWLLDIYQSVLGYYEAIVGLSKEMANKQLDNVKSYLNKIHQKEILEREEEDPESILKQL